jgi:hypothetical protein
LTTTRIEPYILKTKNRQRGLASLPILWYNGVGDKNGKRIAKEKKKSFGKL